ncbi:hypothetical protein B7698_01675 [Streptococcus mitis]|uniref:Uncharacterized protein n=1 Tax=Streptococcus mitis TaxID=28037 RepID=A0A1X1KAW0_STRMT|nr:hypothetical protein B7698_01675 [Streptococcus mitis]
MYRGFTHYKYYRAFHYRSYGTFFYTKIGSIISIGDLPTTNIIEPNKSERLPEVDLFFLRFISNCDIFYITKCDISN